jgi:hypothetical protein
MRDEKLCLMMKIAVQILYMTTVIYARVKILVKY